MPGFLIDTNVWVAACFARHPFHDRVHRFLGELDKQEPGYLCRATEQSWLRLLTTPAIHQRYDTPVISNRAAVRLVQAYLRRPAIRIRNAEPKGTRDLWLKLAATDRASPKTWMDAYLAAFAVCGDLTLATLDSGGVKKGHPAIFRTRRCSTHGSGNVGAMNEKYE